MTHTPGPWRWMDVEFNKRICSRDRRARTRKNSGLFIYSLKGAPLGDPDAPDSRRDMYDYRTVMELRWWSIRGQSLIDGSPSPADRALIAAAPELLEACKALVAYAETEGMEGEALAKYRAVITKAETPSGDFT